MSDFKMPPMEPAVPIVGKPFKVKGLTATVMIECQNCEDHVHLLVGTGQKAACGCGMQFELFAVAWDRDGQVTATIGSALVGGDRRMQ